MSFLDKVKNMFTEEIEEEPIKKEVVQVEIPAPTIEEKEEKEAVSENTAIKNEVKPAAPVFFDDKDFANLAQIEEKTTPQKVESKYKAKEEPKKVFTPTPIISPVYGVLDKNYHKEDITTKKNKVDVSDYGNDMLTIDAVRQKAFGTLEDDLETVMPSDDYTIIEEKDTILDDGSDSMLDDLIDEGYTPRFAQKPAEEEVLATDETDIEEKDMFEEMHQEVEKEEDNLSDSDLFNLIDSMYDKKDDE